MITDHLAIAVDFSEPSRVATEGAFRFAERAGVKRVTMLHSVQQVILPHGHQPEVARRMEDLRRRIHEAAERELAKLCAAARPPEGVEVGHRVVEGNPARAIPEAAKSLGATLLAVGSHARKGVRRWLRGSVCETMLRGARIPTLVLVTGDDAVSPAEELVAVERVLIAVDLHSEAAEVVRRGIEVARALRDPPPEVTLLTLADLPEVTVLQPTDETIGEYLEALESSAATELEALRAHHAGAGVTIGIEVREGDPKEAITEAAKRLGVQLIVVGTHGRGLAPFLDVGSTTAHVVRHADVSVLVVPAHPEHLGQR